MPKISDFVTVSSPAMTSLMPVVEVGTPNINKKISLTDLKTKLFTPATPTVFGTVKVGSTLTIDAAGVIDVATAIPTVGNFIFQNNDASLAPGSTMTLSTYQNGGNKESKLTLSTSTVSSLDVGNNLRIRIGNGTGSEKDWSFGADGSITWPDASVQSTANPLKVITPDDIEIPGVATLVFTGAGVVASSAGNAVTLDISGLGNIDSLTNGSYVVSLGNNGRLTLPVSDLAVSSIESSSSIWITANTSSLKVNSNGAVDLPIVNGTTSLIRTSTSTTINSNGKEWLLNQSGELQVPGSIVPDTNITYDLGSSTKRFRDLYLSGNTINLGGSTISRDPAGGVALSGGALSAPTVVGTGVQFITFQNVTYGLNDLIAIDTVPGQFPNGATIDIELGSGLPPSPSLVPATFEFTYNQNNEIVAFKMTDPGSGYPINGPKYAGFGHVINFSEILTLELMPLVENDPGSIYYKPGGVTYVASYLESRASKPTSGPLPWMLPGDILQPDDTPITATWTDGTRTVSLTYSRTFTTTMTDITNTTYYYYVFEVDPLTALSVTGDFTPVDTEITGQGLLSTMNFHIDYDYPTVLIKGTAPSSLYGQYENGHYLEFSIYNGPQGSVDTSESLLFNIGPIVGNESNGVATIGSNSNPNFGNLTLAETLTLTPGSAPTSPTDGTFAIADGVSWNPAFDGSKQLMLFLNGIWNIVGLTPVLP